MTVQGMTAAILRPGPASPSTAPPRMRSRALFCAGDLADSSVCGSSTMTRSGRIASPLAVDARIPRTRPVMPATRSSEPDAGDPGTVGNTTSPCVQPIRVRSPWNVWPFARCEIPSRRRIGYTTAGKSASKRSFVSMTTLNESSNSSAAPSVAPINTTKRRCA